VDKLGKFFQSGFLMIIRSQLLVGTALVVLMSLTAPASAQDSGRTIWEGFHFGAHVGYTDNDYGVGQTASATPLATTNDDGDGVIGGIVYGSSWQFGQWVLGTDSDWSWSDADSGLNITGAGTGPLSATVDIDYSSSSRIRAGRLVNPSTMVYGTVGVAFARLDVSGTLIAGGSDEETAFGFVFGGGIETTLSNRWFARVEYLHTNYGDESFNEVGGGTFDVDLDTDVVRGAIGKRFDWSPLDLLR